MVHRLLNKTAIPAGLKAIVLLAAIPIVMIAVFHDLAADPLVCLLLLVYTDIITEKDFFENPHKNMLCGIVGALSYFAKTYAFPFFLLHFIDTKLREESANTIPLLLLSKFNFNNGETPEPNKWFCCYKFKVLQQPSQCTFKRSPQKINFLKHIIFG